MACPTGIEPVTPSLEGWCSIRLSYGQILVTRDDFIAVTGNDQKNGRRGEIRTPDILLPKQARYQATLHAEEAEIYWNIGNWSNQIC
jgi:hypothetical protein